MKRVSREIKIRLVYFEIFIRLYRLQEVKIHEMSSHHYAQVEWYLKFGTFGNQRILTKISTQWDICQCSLVDKQSKVNTAHELNIFGLSALQLLMTFPEAYMLIPIP